MLKIRNTLGRKLEEFKPIEPGKVRFYHCGPTVYWTQHIGNMRAMVLSDLVVRSLKFLGFEVKFVRNYTDVGHLTGDNIGDADTGEDRMEIAVKREGLNPQAIATKYVDIFERDIKALNTTLPHDKPRATEVIPESIAMVQTLLDKGFAYSTDLAVYFDVSKFPSYTELSGQRLEDKLRGAGGAAIADPKKKNPTDFAVWVFKAGEHANALQTWSSPFSSSLVENGEGFPGWHLECSVMAKKFLGDTIDLHMGGMEHVPIHHTNEIAQSEAANDAKFVNYWLHNEWLLTEDGKLSKSAGDSLSVQTIIDKGYDPLALRYLFLQAHYRSKQNFTWEALDAAQASLNNLRERTASLPLAKGESWPLAERPTRGSEKYEQLFQEALENDFNIPQALAVTWDLVKSDNPDSAKKASLLEFDKVLGLKLDEVKKEKLIIPEEIQKLIDKREQARKQQNFPLADDLRAQIEEAGFSLEDTPERSKVKAV